MIVRVNKTSDYTTMSNIHLKDRNLSLKAKGLLSVILSLPPDWKYSIEGLTAISKEKESSIKSALNELKNNGYFVITKKMPNETTSGRIEYEWDFYERPFEQKQEHKKQALEILPLEILTLEKQGLENQGQLNTNIVNTYIENTNTVNTNSISNIPLISPEEKLEMLFAEFWKAYPRKDDKKRALKKFKAIKNVEKVLPDILADIEIKKKSDQWNENGGKYIPMPSTYLNNERWNDEATVTMQNEIAEAVSDEVDLFN